MNTDNKARLIEVVDKSLSEVLILHREHADMIADRIEAAGLLAEGLEQVGWLSPVYPGGKLVDMITGVLTHDDEPIYRKTGLLAGSVGVLPTYEQLFMALYDGFGFIDPKACDTITKTALAIIEGKFTSLTRSPEPKGRWISEELHAQILGDLLDLSDCMGGPVGTYLDALKDRIEALRTAPRAKEE